MLIQNNSTTRPYTVGPVSIQPISQAVVPDEYYDDIQAVTDLQLIGNPPVNTQAMIRRATQTLFNSDGTIYGIVDANGTVTVTGRINPFTVAAGQTYSFNVKEGDTITLVGDFAAVGTVTPQGGSAIPISAGSRIIAASIGVKNYTLTTSTGSIGVVVGDGVLVTTPSTKLMNGTENISAVLLGDSVTELGFDTALVGGKPSRSITCRAVFDQANARLDGGPRIKVLNRAGVSGNTFEQMLARYETDVAPHKPKLLVLQGGGNPLDLGYSGEQTLDSMMPIYFRARQDGIPVLFIGTTGRYRTTGAPVSPINGTQYVMSQEYAKFAALCRELQRLRLPGFYFCDMSSSVRDYTSTPNALEAAGGRVLANTVADGTHPSPWGALLTASKELTKTLDKIFPVPTGVRQAFGGYGTTGDQGLIPGCNSLMMGNLSTSKVLAPCTGQAPDPIGVERGAGSIVAASDVVDRIDGGIGRALKLDISGSAALTDHIKVKCGGTYTGLAGIPAYLIGALNCVSATTGAIHRVEGHLTFLTTGSVSLGRTTFGTIHSTKSEEGFTGVPGVFNFGMDCTDEVAIPATTTAIACELRIFTTVGAQLTVHVTDYYGRLNAEAAYVQKYFAQL